MRAFILLIMSLGLLACQQQNHRSQSEGEQQTTIAKKESSVVHLYYSGTMQPIKIDTITSQADGNVTKLNFQYGQRVAKGQLLMEINAPKLQEDFRDAITSFVNSKSKYLSGLTSFQATEALYKAGVTNRETYENEKNSLSGDELSYLNDKYKLEKSIEDVPGVDKKVEDISANDIGAIKKLLNEQHNKLVVHADIDGVALFPLDTNSGGNSDNSDTCTTMQVGCQVKKGQALLSIGDLNGLKINVEINELDINKITTKLQANVTSAALPGIVFQGYVSAVGSQAKNSNGGGQGGLATFPVVVLVPTLTAQQQALMRIGMNVKVDIEIKNPPVILLPINAIEQQNEKTVVTIKTSTGATKTVEVVTGQTTAAGKIEVLRGLTGGEQVIVND